MPAALVEERFTEAERRFLIELLTAIETRNFSLEDQRHRLNVLAKMLGLGTVLVALRTSASVADRLR